MARKRPRPPEFQESGIRGQERQRHRRWADANVGPWIGEERMEQLWAPWRLAYVATAKPPTASDPCFICRGLEAHDQRAQYIVRRTPLSVVLLNRFPYNNGHLLVAPRAHKGDLGEL